MHGTDTRANEPGSCSHMGGVALGSPFNHVLEQLRAHLLARGVSDSAAEDQIQRLRLADQSLDPAPFGQVLPLDLGWLTDSGRIIR